MKRTGDWAEASEGRRSARSIYFATCAPGLEEALHEEARELQLGRLERQVGGVRFEGRIEDAWRANLWLRTAVRVLLRLRRFDAVDADALYRGAQAVDWSSWMSPRSSFVVDAQTKGSALSHSQFVAQRVKDAIVDQFRERTGERPSVDKDAPDVGVHVHLSRDRCSLALDTSGDSLHKRGWRRAQGRAPLAETTAAAIVRLSGWDRRSPLVDPFCGSATILIEAALLATETAPGLFRERFAFEGFPGHDARRWGALKDAARARRTPSRAILLGLDSDPAALESARANLAAAGLDGSIRLESARAEEFEYKRGWNACIVTNPPYGERVGDERALVPVYRRLGERWRERCGGWRIAVLAGNPRLARELGIDFESRKPLKNGAIDCELAIATLAG